MGPLAAGLYPWSYRDVVPLRVHYDSPVLRILYAHGLPSHNLGWLRRLQARDRVIAHPTWHFGLESFGFEREVLEHAGVHRSRWTVLANTPRQREEAAAAGFGAAFVSAACLTNERLFQIRGPAPAAR